ncbi:DNA topoisomerase I [Nitzschia inconspicua]|uniref:DNA topoisomerase n=1 Tax=Nitzschia inconspicua TaxID=303405 RepID=A0A9K3PKI9_9STRA|nr:DNA topoisomerase I [Nitzschia inconspicua]
MSTFQHNGMRIFTQAYRPMIPSKSLERSLRLLKPNVFGQWRTQHHQPIANRQMALSIDPLSLRQFSSSSSALQAATKSKSSKSKQSNARKYSLVVHGPPDFQYPITAKTPSPRPFQLVIVESPSKCQTISKILNQYAKDQNLDYDFVVTSSMGHVRNLPQTKQKDEIIAGIDLENNYLPTYTIIPGKEGLVQELQQLSEKAQRLILATDDDREGEAMAWHLLQLLQETSSSVDSSTSYLRVRFTEITPKAIVDAIQNPETSLRYNLVQAQETRRILDRLAGFTVSPVLWKKIAPGLSAGRVQSVGMALIVQRERERLAFQETEYWGIKGNFTTMNSSADNNNQQQRQLLEANLISINGQSLASGTADFDPNNSNQLAESSQHKLHLQASSAAELIDRIEREGNAWTWTVEKVTSTQRKQNPPLPFITSSLQQEANRRLGLSVSNTMRAAQQLYEKGFISYMRTDSTHLSEDAKSAIRSDIESDYGGPENYVAWMGDRGSKTSKTKKSDDKEDNKKPDPQAAHEAVRPAIQPDGCFVKPGDLPSTFDGGAREVYRLIYQRAVASHMPPQVSNQTSVTIMGESPSTDDDETKVQFRIGGSVVIDPGYTIVYPRQSDSSSPILPSLVEGEQLDCNTVKALMHMTQPPARYTEASFVQELEALGVGRPSTYAGTVQILRDRAYVGSPIMSDSNRRGGTKEVSGPAISAQRAAGGEEFIGSGNARGPMVPSLTAFVVTSLLEKHCNMYVDPSFTAKMEGRLDKIANADAEISEDERVAYLNEFYRGEEGLASRILEIESSVEADDARRADLPSLSYDTSGGKDKVGLFVGPWGPFVKKVSSEWSGEEKSITASLPPGMAADLSTITLKSLNAVLKTKEEDGTMIGLHPEDSRPIRLKVGPYGTYLQWGDDGEEGTTTHTLPRELRSLKNINGDILNSHEENDDLATMLGISLDIAVQYVALPRTICEMDELPIVASIGPYGPYLKYNNTYMSLNPKDGDVLSIEADDARELVTEGIVNRKTKSGAGVLAEIGEIEGSMVTVKSGRFGPYINWKKVNVNLPNEHRDDPSSLSLEEAWSMIEEKAAKNISPKGKKSSKITGADISPGPKRPPSAYLLFSSDKRPEVAGQFSSLGEISKELSRLWKESTDGERQPYLEKAAALKDSYNEDKEKWKAKTQELISNVAKKKSSSGKATMKSLPTRPRSSYIFFCNATRQELKVEYSTLGEVSKELARRWADLDDTSRKVFEDMASSDKKRYEKEMAAFSGDKSPKKLQVAKINGHSVPTIKKRKKSAYMLFCASHRSEIVDEDGKKLSLPEATKVLAQMWRDCDEETRAKFQLLAEDEKEVCAT